MCFLSTTFPNAPAHPPKPPPPPRLYFLTSPLGKPSRRLFSRFRSIVKAVLLSCVRQVIFTSKANYFLLFDVISSYFILLFIVFLNFSLRAKRCSSWRSWTQIEFYQHFGRMGQRSIS